MSATNLTVSYCGNPSSYGGGIQSQSSNMTLYNTVFDHNLADTGGAIGPNCIATCAFLYSNVTFSNN
jgi:hypothetical protein